MFLLILKKNFKKATLLSVAFIGLIYFLEDSSSINFFSPEFLLTFIMYLILFAISLDALEKNKILGLLMSFSLLFLPPAIFPGFAGKLFPLTYGIFIIYLFFTYGLSMFRNWKNNAGL
tara:strand:+ start:358 stop:711 length:354 start_codon:yes stop_codon:yes gene_type:complete